MNINEAIEFLDGQISDPTLGLPLDVFLFISRISPLVNVDLLVQDERGRTLLAWRDDPYAGSGWHVPGGILRFQETIETRIRKVAETEIGTEVASRSHADRIPSIDSCRTADAGTFPLVPVSLFRPPRFCPREQRPHRQRPGLLGVARHLSRQPHHGTRAVPQVHPPRFVVSFAHGLPHEERQHANQRDRSRL